MATKTASKTAAAAKTTPAKTSASTTTKAVEEVEETTKDQPVGDGAEINDTFGGSPVTSGIGGEETEGETKEEESRPKTFAERAVAAGIGLVQVEGIDFRYVGVAPAQDKDAKTPSGYPITTDNSRFTPLADVAFHPTLRFKDQKSGEYFYAPDVTGFEGVSYEGNPLVPAAE